MLQYYRLANKWKTPFLNTVLLIKSFYHYIQYILDGEQ